MVLSLKRILKPKPYRKNGFIMKKTSLKAISSCLAAIMLFSTTSAYAATSYAEEIPNDIIGKYNSYDKEGTVYIDLSQGTTVTVDTSNFEEIDLGGNARAVYLPYSGGVAFGGNTSYALSPIFIINSTSNLSQLKFKPSNFVENKKIKLNVYAHSAGTDANTYTKTGSHDLEFNAFTSYKIILSGTMVQGIDKLYLEFIETNGYATSFDYTVSLTNQ